jgi:hypothetical protein
LLIRGGVNRKRGFLELGDKLGTTVDELDYTLFGRRKENIELLDVGIEAELFEFGGDPFGVVFVVGRTDVVGPGREPLHIGAKIIGSGNGAQLFFPLALGARGCGGVAEERLLVGDDVIAEWGEREYGKNKRGDHGATIHCSPIK